MATDTGSSLGEWAAKWLQQQQPQSQFSAPGTQSPLAAIPQLAQPQQQLAMSLANPMGGAEPDLAQQVLAARFQQPQAQSSGFQPQNTQQQGQPQSIQQLMAQIQQLQQPTYGDISNTAIQRFSTGNPALTTEGTVTTRLTPQFAMLKELSTAQNQQSDYAKNIAQAGFLNAQSSGLGVGNNDTNSNLTGEEFLKTLPPLIAAQVKAMDTGDLNFPTGFAAKAPYWQARLNALYQYNPHASQQTAAAVKAFNTGKQGDQARSFNVAYSHLNTLGQLADALQNNDTRALNAISNTFKTQFGQTAPTDFNTAKQVVANEVIKAVVGAGGGVGDREKAQEVINAANSPQQLAGTINTYKELIRGQLGGLKQQYEQSTGRRDFERLLSPDVQSSLNPPPVTDVKSLSDQDLLRALQ